MKKPRVVITGLGVIAPNGIGKDAFWDALFEGCCGIKPITLFETAFFKAKSAGECGGFNAEEFLGVKGLRNLDRSTKLVCCAAKLAIEDARLNITEENTNDIGVVTATTLSVIGDISEFIKQASEQGPKSVNPAMFPGTTINFPSSQISIRFGVRGFNTTVSTGFSASLDALKYAVDFIKLNRAKVVLVAGVEALFFQSFVGFHKLGFLAGIKGEELCCPFDRRRNGISIGEGAGVLVLENRDYAVSRKTKIYAEVKAVESLFDPFRSGKYNPKGDGLKRSISHVLKRSQVKREGIDYICAAANSVQTQDAVETKVIKEVFGARAKEIPVSSIKSMIGETVSASGVLQIAASLGAIERNLIPPTINYKEPDPECDLDYVANKAREATVRVAMSNAFGFGGHNSVLVFKEYRES